MASSPVAVTEMSLVPADSLPARARPNSSPTLITAVAGAASRNSRAFAAP